MLHSTTRYTKYEVGKSCKALHSILSMSISTPPTPTPAILFLHHAWMTKTRLSTQSSSTGFCGPSSVFRRYQYPDGFCGLYPDITFFLFGFGGYYLPFLRWVDWLGMGEERGKRNQTQSCIALLAWRKKWAHVIRSTVARKLPWDFSRTLPHVFDAKRK